MCVLVKAKIKFKYKGSWTNWYDINAIPDLNQIEIEAVMIEEEMSKEEAAEYIKEFYDMNFKGF